MASLTNPHSPQHPARIRYLGLLLALLTILSVPLAIAYSGQTANAGARVAAVGKATIVWGNPFFVPTVSYGTGWEKTAIRGTVLPTPNANGYYTFQSMKLIGSLHTEWANASQRYVLDASFATIDNFQEYSHYYPVKIIPAANALEATGLEFTGTLSVNGESRALNGLVAITTAVPGYIGFQGSSPAIYVVFYVSSDMQVTIGWSQASQTVRGIYHPACSNLVHIVRLTAGIGW